MKENIKEFEKLVKWFKESKYSEYVKVHTDHSELFDFCNINTDTLILGFCNKHEKGQSGSSHIYINGCISLEHRDLFDKWRNCITPPIYFPKNKRDFNSLIALMDYIGSDDFFNEAEELDDDEFDEKLEGAYTDIEHLFVENL